MGLDWNPLGRPKAGRGEEFERLFAELTSGPTPAKPRLFRWLRSPRELTPEERAARLERFHAISDPPFATLDAPRVGFDPVADAWLTKTLEAGGRIGELEKAREEMHGYYVLALLPPCDGFPHYSNNGLYEGLDRYSFRGQFLNDVRGIIGTRLHERAWEWMLARDLLAYADDLDAVARPWAERAGVANVDGAPESPPIGDDDPASQAHILFSAIRWCRFWGSRGHGLEPYY